MNCMNISYLSGQNRVVAKRRLCLLYLAAARTLGRERRQLPPQLSIRIGIRRLVTLRRAGLSVRPGTPAADIPRRCWSMSGLLPLNWSGIYESLTPFRAGGSRDDETAYP